MQKKIIIFIGLTIVLFSSCIKSDHDFLWKTYSYQEEQKQNDSIATFKFDGEIALPILYGNDSIIEHLRNEVLLLLFGSNFENTRNSEVMKSYCKELEQENQIALTKNSAPHFTAKPLTYEELVRGTIVFQTDSFLSYEAKLYLIAGEMSNGLLNNHYLVFDLTQGKSLSEIDLFGPDAMMALDNLLIKSANALRNGEKLPKRDSNIRFTYPTANSNFFVTASGITFVYNPYEIAPYAYGATAIELKWSQLLPLMRRTGPIYHFAQAELSKL